MTRRGRSRSPFSLFSFQDIITCVSGIIILITLVLALELSQRKQGSPQVDTAKLAAQLREAVADAQAEAARLEDELKRRAESAQEVGGASASALRHELFVLSEQIGSLEAELASLQRQEQTVKEKDEAVQARRFDREKDSQKLADEEQKVKDLDEKLKNARRPGQLFYNPRTADGKLVWLIQIEGDRILVAAAGSTVRPGVYTEVSALLFQTPLEKWLASRSAQADFFFLLVRPAGTDHFVKLKELLVKRGFGIGYDLLGIQQSAVDPEKGAGGL
jgi:Skp family chaperone for outer membrane proteins